MSADRTKFIILIIGVVALAGLVAMQSGMFGNNATETPAITELPTGDANVLADGGDEAGGDAEMTDSAETTGDMAEGAEGTTEDTMDSAEPDKEETVQGGSTEGEVVDGSDEMADSAESEMAEGDTEATENPEAGLEVAEPVVTNAVISFDDAGNQLLTVSGTADARCQTVRFLLDGSSFGETPLDADGTWAITGSEIPAEGTYESQIECVTADGAALSTPRPFMVGQPGLIESDETAEETDEEDAGEESAETSTEDTDEAAADTDEAASEDGAADGTGSEEATGEESADSEQAETNPDPDTPATAPTLTLVNNMDDWIGGPLWVSGEAEPFTLIDVVFTNGETTIQDTVSANDSGVWNYRASLVDPGTWDISAAISGEGSTEPQEVVVVPDDIDFGSAGDCRGKIPPFGTIEGNEYIVAPCEYFSVIFVRLGVSYSQLLNANSQIFNLDNLRAGDRLNIPPFP